MNIKQFFSFETKKDKILTITGLVLCIILIPMLIINCTLIIKSFVNKDEVPSIGGVMPLIVLSPSMEPEIMTGDIIFCKVIDGQEIEVGDYVAFFDPASSGSAVVTHEVVKLIYNDAGEITAFRTKGINNNSEDPSTVPIDNLVGIYVDFRIPLVGHVAMFMQSTWGLILCVVVPLGAFVAYDVLRRKKHEKKEGADIDALKAELAALRAEKMQNAECKMQNDPNNEEKPD
ncbi:MAG: signal peptidase I [Clostridia bacterium]|nr:signal peptidase I [Clostridia bacterium]MBQ9131402.1 signal peptidase I [Clostridia bacterium]